MSTIKNVLHRVARRSGWDFRRYHRDNWACLRRAHIIQRLEIDLLLDIGANRGGYVSDLRTAGYKGKAVSFEPLPAAFQALQRQAQGDECWHCENVAVGDIDGEVDIHLSDRETSSSLLVLASAHLTAAPDSKTVGNQKVQMRRLDTILPGIPLAANVKCPYLKADVQGFELQVLKGAVKTLNDVKAIELELSLAPVFEGVPLIAEMIGYVQMLGFSLVSFEPIFFDPVSGYVLQGDGIFVRIGH